MKNFLIIFLSILILTSTLGCEKDHVKDNFTDFHDMELSFPVNQEVGSLDIDKDGVKDIEFGIGYRAGGMYGYFMAYGAISFNGYEIFYRDTVVEQWSWNEFDGKDTVYRYSSHHIPLIYNTGQVIEPNSTDTTGVTFQYSSGGGLPGGVYDSGLHYGAQIEYDKYFFIGLKKKQPDRTIIAWIKLKISYSKFIINSSMYYENGLNVVAPY